MKIIDSDLRARIKAIAEEFFLTRDEAEINKFYQELRSPKNFPLLNFREYVAQNGKLKDFFELLNDVLWLREERPDEGPSVWVCGLVGKVKKVEKAKKVENNEASEISEKSIAQVLVEVIKAHGGRYALSSVPGILKDRLGITDYKTISKGFTLGVWLKKCFSDAFVVDNNEIYLTGSEYPPVPVPVPVPESEKLEIAQMHSLAFMNWWTTNAKKLQSYTKITDSSVDWSQCVAEGLFRSILGKTPIFSYTADSVEKIAFDTGFKTAGGNVLYCIIRTNPRIGEGFQPFVIDDFCCPAEEETPLAEELKSYAPEVRISSSSVEEKYDEMRLVIEQLRSIQSSLTAMNVGESVAEGKPVDIKAFNLIKQYYGKWEQAKEIAVFLGWISDVSELISIDFITNTLECSDEKDATFKKAAESLLQVLGRILEYCQESNAISTAEIIEQDIETVKGSTSENLDELRMLLDYYVCFTELTYQFAELTEEAITGIDYISEHFVCFKKKHRVFSAYFLGQEDESRLQNAKELDEVARELASLDMSYLIREKDDQDTPIDTDNMLDCALQKNFAGIMSRVADFPANNFERAVVFGDFDKAAEYLDEEEVTVPVAESKDAVTAKLKELLASKENESLLLYECAMLVYSLIGNHNRTAEKYFIAALAVDSEKSAEALMKVYMDENRADRFYLVWNRYCREKILSLQEFRFLLCYFAAEGELAVSDYLGRHPWYSYVQEYAQLISDVLADSGYSTVLDEINGKLAYLKTLPEMNEFEKMLVDSDSDCTADDVKSYIEENAEYMAASGYTDEDIRNIVMLLDSEFVENEKASPEARLYYLQKNRNGTAERLICKTLLLNFDEDNFSKLMHIFVRAGRYDEICSLYEFAEDAVEDNTAVRNAYLCALFCTESPRAYSFTRDNFENVLKVLSTESFYCTLLTDAMSKVRDGENEELARLTEKIESIRELLSDSVLSSIALLSKELREVAVDIEKLLSFGLDQERANAFQSVYRTDNYSHERSVLGVAKRIFSFVGSCCNAAETVASLAKEMGCDTTALMWDIYQSSGNTDGLYQVLQEFPAFINGKEREYCSVLFAKGMFAEFLEKAEESYYSAEEYLLKTLVAECNLGHDISETVTKVAELLVAQSKTDKKVSADFIADIVSAAVSFGYISDYEEFISSNSDYILSSYGKNEVRCIVSADGKAGEDMLKQLQKYAAANENTDLVIYLFESFKLGRYKGASAEYISRMLSQCECAEEGGKETLFKKLKTIYSDNSECITGIVLRETKFVLQCEKDEKALEEGLIDIVENTFFTKDGLSTFLDLLLDNKLSMSGELWSAIVKTCVKTGLQRECIEYIHEVPNLVESIRDDALSSVCSLYIDALRDGYFNTEWAEVAENICVRLIGTTDFSVAAYCLYRIYAYTDRSHLAGFMLLFIMENRQKMTREMLGEAEEEYGKVFEKQASMYDLFVDVLGNTDLKEFDSFCASCGRFITGREELLSRYYSASSDNVDKVLLVKMIFAQPKNIAFWEKCLEEMPSEKKPNAYCKALYKISVIENNLVRWKKCIDACESFAQDELLSEVILNCVSNISVKRELYDFRAYLCQKSENNPLYFANMDEERLNEIITLMCTQINEEFGAAKHNAIRDISAIAIATGSVKVFRTMKNQLGLYLYETNTNLGFAVVCRLILKKWFAEAAEMLSGLSSATGHKYPKLVEKLAAKDEDGLVEWSSQGVNGQLLQMILPDGNIPGIKEINELVLGCSTNGKAEDAANILCEIIDNAPKDYGCYMALFVLCKQLPGRIDLLHRALCGLIQNTPVKSTQTYYDRSREDYAVFLAKINAIIISGRDTDKYSNIDGYDFRVTAKDYYIQCENDYSKSSDVDILKKISDAQDKTMGDLMNQSKINHEIISGIIWSSITCSWSDLLLRCWKDNIPLKIYMKDYYEQMNSNDALGRSILKAVYSLESTVRPSFKKWVNDQLGSSRKNHTDVADFIYNTKCYDNLGKNVLDSDIFDIPFEEYCLFTQIYDNTIKQYISKDPGTLDNCARIVGALIMEPHVMIEMWHTAMDAFETFDNLVAYNLFGAMLDLTKKFSLQHKTEKHSSKSREVYESMERVAGAFAGIDVIVNKIKKDNFNAHSCLNMVLALAYTNRANEINSLKQYFSESNQALTAALLICLNPSVDDSDKLSAICDIEDAVAKSYLCYIVLKRNFGADGLWFLKSQKTAMTIKQMYDDIAKLYSSNFNAASVPFKYIWIMPQSLNDRVYRQKEAVKPEAVKSAVSLSETEEVNVKVKFSFVSHLTAAGQEDKTIAQLWDEHEKIYTFGAERYEARVSFSERIYRLALSQGADEKELNDYALRYGVDYYYNCIVSKNYDRANKLIIEMVNAYEFNRDSQGSALLKKLVCDTALYELFSHGYSTIHDLIETYAVNRQAFVRMRNMLPNSMSDEMKDINNIYMVLDYLKDMVVSSSQNIKATRTALFNAIQQLGSIGVTGWDSLKAIVQRMIQNEINKIDKRPILDIEIISKKSNLPYGNIFGQIENIGNDTAENIILQIAFDDDFMSDQFYLMSLEKGEQAVFEIPYSVADGTEKMGYDIMVTYNSNEEQFDSVVKGNLMTFEYEETPYFDDKLYKTDTPVFDFVVLEDGTIHSDNFFGREEEKHTVASMFSADRFINYKNVIIQGVRRAGKTSVLHYMRKYIDTNCEDAVAVYTSCLGTNEKVKSVYSVFMKNVMEDCRRRNYGNCSDEEWDRFSEKWSLKEEEADCDASDLKFFYQDLKSLNAGKGLILIVDEFDVLLESVERKRGVDSNLLNPLRDLLLDPYCQEAVHLVICGSNKMMRYKDGGTFNQLFQQFGNNIIDIGRLLKKEMVDMLENPYKAEYPFVRITDEAMGWIWHFTKGLVWYSKLVAGMALSRARQNERSTVYPSDIFYAVGGIVDNTDLFDSLVTSCEPNELRLADAMQGVTAKASEYVSASRLLEALEGEFRQKDVEEVGEILEKMKVVERNPYDKHSYRFDVPLYWHYFRKKPSNFERVKEVSFEFRAIRKNDTQ